VNQILHPIEPEELMAYLDGELAGDRASATAAHLGECGECQRLVAEMRGVTQNLQSWKIKPPESAMSADVANALAEKQMESQKAFRAPKTTWREVLSRRWTTLAWAGTVAAVVLVVFSSIRFPGGNASNVFSQVGSTISGDDLSSRREAVILQAPASPIVNGSPHSLFVSRKSGNDR
jgi:anti-sigma factor RsiW